MCLIDAIFPDGHLINEASGQKLLQDFELSEKLARLRRLQAMLTDLKRTWRTQI